MKKLLTTLVLLLLLIPTTANAVVDESSFSDVTFSHSNNDAIDYVKSQNIVSGYNDGTFKPDKTINRAEFTKIIIGSKFSTEQIESCIPQQSFSDVDPFLVPWIYQYSCIARNHKIINGYSDGTFKPNKEISFIEASKIIANTFGYEVTEHETWYKPFVEKLSEKKAIPTSITQLQKNITRGEMAEMVYRLKAGVLDKETLSYEDLESSNWKTHIDKTLGIKFQYPSSYVEKETPNGEFYSLKLAQENCETACSYIHLLDDMKDLQSYVDTENYLVITSEDSFLGQESKKGYFIGTGSPQFVIFKNPDYRRGVKMTVSFMEENIFHKILESIELLNEETNIMDISVEDTFDKMEVTHVGPVVESDPISSYNIQFQLKGIKNARGIVKRFGHLGLMFVTENYLFPTFTKSKAYRFNSVLQDSPLENKCVEMVIDKATVVHHESGRAGVSIHSENIKECSNIEQNPISFYLLGQVGDDMGGDISRYLVQTETESSAINDSIENKIINSLNSIFDIKTNVYGSTNLQNMLYLSDLIVSDIRFMNDTYLINLHGKIIGVGSVADAFIKLQITKTIEQFTDNYSIVLNDSKSEWDCALDASGLCR